jgi:hypothetical protein
VGEHVYFFDYSTLYAYDVKARRLAWKAQPGSGVAPYPVVYDKVIVLPMNYCGKEGQHTPRVVTLARDTGQVLSRTDTGGLGVYSMPNSFYLQSGNLLIVTSHGGSSAYRLYVLPSSPAAKAPSDDRERLITSVSPMRLLASDVKYDGQLLQGKPRRSVGEAISIGNIAYYQAVNERGLIAEDPASKTATAYRPFDLAVAAGWCQPKEGGYLHQDIRGLYREGNRLWMGSYGVGVLAYDTKTRTWSRYSPQKTPVPGLYVTVLYGDDEYVFATYYATAERSLQVYSTRHQRWLRIVAIPTRNAVRLGTSKDLPRVAVGWDHRRFADQPYVPIGGRDTLSVSPPDKITRRPDGSYLLRSGHRETESSWTDLVVRKAELETAFAHFGPPPRGDAAARWEMEMAKKVSSLYRSDVSLVKAMTADAAIHSGDSRQKVIDLFGQPFDRHKEEHRWSYFYAYGTPHSDSAPMATVTVRFDGDVVRDVEVRFRPARDAVESAKEQMGGLQDKLGSEASGAGDALKGLLGGKK